MTVIIVKGWVLFDSWRVGVDAFINGKPRVYARTVSYYCDCGMLAQHQSGLADALMRRSSAMRAAALPIRPLCMLHPLPNQCINNRYSR